MSTEIDDPNNVVWFAIIVDGEYTGRVGMGANPSSALAGLRSDPKIVEMSEEQVVQVSLGWVYDGTTFVPASE